MLRRASALPSVGSVNAASSTSVAQITRSLQRLGLRDNTFHNGHRVARAAQSAKAHSTARFYATPGRPKKSDTGATKAPRKSVNKTPAKVAAAKKAAASKKKPVKKKAVKKVAPKKKVLTEEQQEKKKLATATKKSRDELKALKETALLKAEPKKAPSNAYALFNQKYDGPIEGKTLGERVKVVHAAYKDLPSSEIEKLNHEIVQKQRDYEKAYSSWVSSLKPVDVVAANNARRLLKRRTKARQVILIKDDRLPKRPSAPYTQFSNERNASGDFKNISVAERGRLIGKEWRELSSGEKQKYEDLYEADRKRYVREYTDVYGQAPRSRSASPASA